MAGIDRTVADDLAGRLVVLYADAQERLAAGIALRLASGLDTPTWAADKLAALGGLRRWVEVLLTRLDGAMRAEVLQALVLAFTRGGDTAMAELARLQSTHPEWLRLAGVADPAPQLRQAIAARGLALSTQLQQVERALPGGHALNRLVWSLSSRLAGTHMRILRWAEDAYREVVATAAAPDVLLGLATRRLASQRAWNRLLDQGVTGFIDTGGRRWNLASYVEMATRSSVAQAAVEGHLDRLASAGLDLVIVSNAPQECSRCRPWEGKILTRGGPDGRRTIVEQHATSDGVRVSISVAGSVDEAVRAGLMHPNCRHSLNLYLPGVTKIPTNTADPEGDAARQRLRALERQVRAARLKQAGALTPQGRRDAAAEVRARQAAIRQHVSATAHLGIFRHPERERLNLGNVRA